MKKNKFKNKRERNDLLTLQGLVVEALPAALFKVSIENYGIINTVLAGKIRQNKIHILPGDMVQVEVSVYDVTRGRIVWRQ